jgi:hypothetical protein
MVSPGDDEVFIDEVSASLVDPGCPSISRGGEDKLVFFSMCSAELTGCGG